MLQLQLDNRHLLQVLLVVFLVLLVLGLVLGLVQVLLRLPEGLEVSPALHAQDDVAKDVEYLLEYCAAAHRLGQEASWTKVLPLYPTSPLDRIG